MTLPGHPCAAVRHISTLPPPVDRNQTRNCVIFSGMALALSPVSDKGTRAVTYLDHPIPTDDHDATLLEGLFQLSVSGETSNWQFEKIESEVYSRLLAAYAA